MSNLFNVNNIAENLELTDGIWYSKAKTHVSYPDEGNDLCLQIEPDSFWFKHRNNCILKALENYPPCGAILDVGGGNGYVTLALQENGYEIVLLEAGNPGVLNAKKRNVINIICSAFEDVKFKNTSISAVAVFDVMEHIDDQKKFLNNLYNILTEKGILYITVPAYNCIWSKDDVLANHKRRYSLCELKKILNKYGFEVEYSTYFFSFLPIPIFVCRTIPSIMQIRKINSVKSFKKDHILKNNISSYITGKIFDIELSLIQAKKRIIFGSSCLVIAKKT